MLDVRASPRSALPAQEPTQTGGEQVDEDDLVKVARRLRPAGLRPGDRLAAVSAQFERHLDVTAPARYVRSAPARGDGRDLLGGLSRRTDADRVTALLVEDDARLGTRAREAARTLPAQVAVRRADAAQSDIYAHAVPADLVPLCAASSATSATLTGGRPCTRHRNSALRVPR